MQLARMGLLLAALLLIPWLAANPPDWTILRDPDWVQAWGTIIAVAAGFLYVGVQAAIQRSDKRREQAAHCRYLLAHLEMAQREMDRAYAVMAKANKTGGNVRNQLGRDSFDLLADELLVVDVRSVGSWDAVVSCRMAGMHAKAYANAVNEVGQVRTVSDDMLSRLTEFRDGFHSAVHYLRAEIGHC